MGILSKIFGSADKAAGGLVKQAADAVDQFVTTDAEKQKLKNQLQERIREHHRQLEEELTSRHKVDMNSDSWLSKNVRPLTLIFLMFSFFTLATTDGNIGSFQIDKNYIELLGQMLTLAFSFYFGSRGLEKINQARQNRKQ